MQPLAGAFQEVVDACTARDFDKALKGLIWIHDHPNPADPSSEMFRRAYGFATLGLLAREYEPAKTYLIDLVAQKRDSVARGTADKPTQADLRALEEALRDAER